MITLNQLVKKFEDFFEAHQFVQRFTYGIYHLTQIDKDYRYPHVHIQPASVSQGALVGLQFDLIIQDLPRVEDGKQLNVQEIHSDTLQTILDFQAYLEKGEDFFDNWNYEFTVNSVDAFWDTHTQTTSGWQMSFTIAQHNDYDICNIPLVGTSPQPGTICQPATLVDVDGNTLREIDSGTSFTLRSYSIQNSGMATHTAPITSVAANGRISGETLIELMQGFSASTGTLSDTAQDIYDGSSAAMITAIQNVFCGTTSIIPAYIRPTTPVSSYATGDLGWQYANGVYDRLDTERIGSVRYLGADNYTLSANTPNKYGTTARFTFSNGDNAWDGSSFITTYPVDAEDYVIECHLTGIALYVANLGNVNWAGAITACDSLVAGSYDWRIGAPNEYENFLLDRDNLYYQGGNPFRRGVVSGYSDFYTWTGRTGETNTTTAFRVSVSQDSSLLSKTANSLMSVYAVANFDADYTP